MDVNEKNCEILFDYLKSILYDTEVKKPDLDALDESFRRLGLGLEFLDRAVREMKQYTAALATGNLSVPSPSRDNFLCENLKNIHANLNHLTWQAKQVARGDYSQSVSYMGEFSEAFNAMVAQLRERDAKVKEEARMVQKHLDVVEGYNKLLLELIARSEEDILVTDAEQDEILYTTRENVQSQEIYGLILEKQQQRRRMGDTVAEWVWELEDSMHRIYRITSARMEWQGRQAYAHIILEITREREEQGRLELKAYSDTLTNIGNRSFFIERAKEILESGEALVICYCDLDHLKYINDNHGHAEGDAYICSFVECAQQYIHEQDVFTRLGGDEFCILFRSCTQDIVRQRMEQVQQAFAQGYQPYNKSFCYGLVELPEGHGLVDLNEIMEKADLRMYQQKRERKNAR